MISTTPETVCGLRVAGKPHVYKLGGFYRIRLPQEGALPEREYWYLNCDLVRSFFRAYRGQ